MWFLIEPISNRKDPDHASHLLLGKIFHDIKLSRDVRDPNDIEQAKVSMLLIVMILSLLI